MQEHSERAPDSVSEAAWEEFSDYCEIKNRILAAVLSAPAARSGQVAAQLRVVVAEIDCLSTVTSQASIEEVLHVNDIIKIAADLTELPCSRAGDC
jgi:hypothetical protein